MRIWGGVYGIGGIERRFIRGVNLSRVEKRKGPIPREGESLVVSKLGVVNLRVKDMQSVANSVDPR